MRNLVNEGREILENFTKKLVDGSITEGSEKIDPKEFTIEKKFPSGALEVSTIYKNRLVRQVYYGYSKNQAVSEFANYLRSLKEGRTLNEASGAFVTVKDMKNGKETKNVGIVVKAGPRDTMTLALGDNSSNPKNIKNMTMWMLVKGETKVIGTKKCNRFLDMDDSGKSVWLATDGSTLFV